MVSIIKIIERYLFLHPTIAFALSLGFLIQNILIIGILIGYAADRKGKRNQLDIDVMRYKYYKAQAESLEKYRNAAGQMEFYRKEAEHKNHDNIRLRRKLGSIMGMAADEM